MKIETVKLSRKFSLGNYEMLEVGFEASVGEGENPLDVLRGLEDLAESYLTARTNNDPEGDRAGFSRQAEAEDAAEIEQELLEHEGWKSKKLDDGSYAKGSLSWGWDFIYEKDKQTRRFSAEAVAAIQNAGVLAVGEYMFQLGLNGSAIQVKKDKAR